MNPHRIEQINELIKRELGYIFVKEFEFPEGSLATITQVDTSGDLTEAKIWVSVFPFLKANKVIRELNKNKGHLRSLLGKRLRSLNPLPKIKIVLDSTEERVGKVNDIFGKTKK